MYMYMYMYMYMHMYMYMYVHRDDQEVLPRTTYQKLLRAEGYT